jgi:hypothetical protein
MWNRGIKSSQELMLAKGGNKITPKRPREIVERDIR